MAEQFLKWFTVFISLYHFSCHVIGLFLFRTMDVLLHCQSLPVFLHPVNALPPLFPVSVLRPSLADLSLSLSLCSDGRFGAAQTGRAGLSDPWRPVHRLGDDQRPVLVLLLWKPHRPWSLRPEALPTGKPIPTAAGQHRVWGQHPGSLLQEQLQTSHRHQVNYPTGRRLRFN